MEPTDLIRESEMTRRQIALADGRYLIFYTFTSVEEHDKENDEEDVRIENLMHVRTTF